MKMKNILILGSLAIGMLSTTSCDDKLGALPTQSKVDGNLVVDQKSAETALNGIYYMYAQCGVDYYDVLSTGCCMTQEIYPADMAGVIEFYQGPYILELHGPGSYDTNPSRPESSTNNQIWKLLYSQLTTANGVIQQVTNAPDSWFSGNRKAEILGEAYAMRALIYYQLLRYFGYYWDIDSPYGILLRTTPSSASGQAIERSSVKDTYDAILNDLKYAIENATEENPNYFANRWVAKGLKVRVLMMRGQAGDYAEAAEIAGDIIDHSPYVLEENVVDIFHTLGLKSKEVMFGIQPKSNQTDVIEAYYYRDDAQYFPTKAFYSMFENDPRKEILFQEGEPYNFYGTIITPILICKHFAPDNINANEVEESQYQMRLTEMYLLRAEALARTGDVPGAKSLLKTVMEHAGITDFTDLDAANDESSFMEIYFKEYLRNLFCESGRELELMIRMPKEIVNKFNSQYYNSNGDDAFGYSIFAIPTNEFKYNNKITKEDQNPGYSVF